MIHDPVTFIFPLYFPYMHDLLRSVMKNSDLRYSDAAVIHVGTNDFRKSINLDYKMGEVYDLVNMGKAKFQSSRLVLSGVLRSKDVD